MNKVILGIDGMMCGMCEAHICDAIRKVCGKAKVSASHAEGRAEILLDETPDIARIRAAIRETGYKVTDVKVETVDKPKKGFSLFRRG